MVQSKTYTISGKKKGGDKMKKGKILFSLVLTLTIVFVATIATADIDTKQCTDSLLEISNRAQANDGKIPDDISKNQIQKTAICSEQICLGEKSQFSTGKRSVFCWGSATLYREMGNYQKAIELYRKGCDMGFETACESLNDLQTKIKSLQTEKSEEISFTITNRDGTNIQIRISKSHPVYKTLYEMIVSGSGNARFELVDCMERIADFFDGKSDATLQVARCGEVMCLMHKELVENNVLPSLSSAGLACYGSAEMYRSLGIKEKSLSLHVYNCDVIGYLTSCFKSGLDYLLSNQESKGIIYLEKACKNKYSQDEKDAHIAACSILSGYKFDMGNYTDAVAFAKESCDKNIEDPKYRTALAAACKVLGYAYSLGRGVKANENQAMMYFHKACDLGLDDICRKIGR